MGHRVKPFHALAGILVSVGLLWNAAIAQTSPTAVASDTPRFTIRQNRSDWVDYALARGETAAASSSSESQVTELYDLQTQRTILTVPIVGKVALSRDGRTMLVTDSNSRNPRLLVWRSDEPAGGKALPIDRPVRSLALSDDARLSVAGLGDSTVRAFDNATARELWRVRLDGDIWALSLSADGSRLLVSYGFGALASPGTKAGGSAMFDARTGQRLADLDDENGYAVIGGFLSDDGAFAATTRDMAPGIAIWDARSGKLVRKIIKDNAVGWFALSSNGDRVAAVDDFGFLSVVRVRDGRQLWQQDTRSSGLPQIEKLMFSSDGTRIVIAGKGFDPISLMASNGAVIPSKIVPPAEPLPMEAIQFSKNGNLLLARSRKSISVWSFETGRPVLVTGSDTGPLTDSPSPAFDHFGGNGTPTANKICEPQTAKLSPLGDRIAFNSCFDNNIVFTSPEGFPLGIISLEADAGQANGFNLLGFSPDGKLLAVDTTQFHREPGMLRDHKLRAYDPVTFKLRFAIDLGVRYVVASGFSPDGNRFWAITMPSPIDRDPSGVRKPEILVMDGKDGSVQHREYLPCRPGSCDIFASPRVSVSPSASRIAYLDDDYQWLMRRVDADGATSLVEPDRFLRTILPAFSCDDRLVAFGDLNRNLVVRNFEDGQVSILPGIVKSQEMSLTFSCADNSLFVLGGRSLLKLSALDNYRSVTTVPITYGPVSAISEIGADTFAVATPLGVELVASAGNTRLASLSTMTNGDYLVAAADGRFDAGRLEQLGAVSWAMSDDTMRPLPLSVFARDYFEPRLIPRIRASGAFATLQPLQSLNRIQPEVKIVSVSPDKRPDQVVVRVQASPVSDASQPNRKTSTDAYDLRLFRDGRLVGRWPDEQGGSDELAPWRLRTHVPPAVENRFHDFVVSLPTQKSGQPISFTTYAFNEDRVRSEIAHASYTVPANIKPRKPRAYVIAIGADAYQAPSHQLNFAVRDARAMSGALSHLENYETVAVTLTSEGSDETSWRATKANVRAVLDRLAGRAIPPDALAGIEGSERLTAATPDDLVIVTFSGHGYTSADGVFYLLASDSGEATEITAATLDKFISSRELSEWLRHIDAGQMALVIDACHSAASIDQPGFKPGPMGDQGLGQLAYDKAMVILAASQADAVALESTSLKHGLLTYALVIDGLAVNGDGKRAADADRDGHLTLGEWLRWGERHTPALYADIQYGRRDAFYADRDAVIDSRLRARAFTRAQTPALFDFSQSSERRVVLQ